jgi:hypothetical protein
MNYLAELKAFYDTLAVNPLSSHDIALWYALMSIANKSGWKNEFPVALSVLAFFSGANESTVKRSRNKLAQCGYITWRSRNGNQSAVYHLNSLVGRSEPQSGLQSSPQSEPQSGLQSVPINKTKLNETNIPPISPVEQFEKYWSVYPKRKNRALTEKAYVDAVLANVPEEDIVSAAVNYAEYVKIQEIQERYIKNPDRFLSDNTFTEYLPGIYKKPAGKAGGNKFNQFQQNDYDFDALEKDLLSN